MRKSLKYGLLSVALILCVVLGVRGYVLQVASGTWAAQASLTQARSGASAVLLQDGRVLVTGGDGVAGTLASAEIIGLDGTSSAAASMSTTRSKHVSAVLANGSVLVAGGTTSGGGAINTAEIYDPVADSWTTVAGAMIEARSNATAAVLQDGRVLIAGGDKSGVASSTIEIFDPVALTFSFAGALGSPRTDHAMAQLSDGRVFIGGGSNGSVALNTTDIYDPVAGTVGAGPALSALRMGHSATRMLDGRVLIAGGNNGTADLASAEIFDPVAGTITAVASSLTTARQGHLAFLLPNNNTVLIVGGTSAGVPLASAEVFTPWLGTFAPTGSLTASRSNSTGSPMKQDGLLVVAGGQDASGIAAANTDIYGFATVKTDQADYSPGQIVTITGSGWQPGETVSLTLVESPFFDTHGPFTTIADSNGSISNSSFVVDSHDIGIHFNLTAAGAVSQAQTMFSDGNAGNGDGTMIVSPSSVIGSSTGNSLVFTFSTANGKDFNTGSQATILVPAGWTAPTSSNVVVARNTCSATTLLAITGTGPWTIPINMTCAGGTGFTATYNAVTAPSTTGGNTFTTQTKQNGGTLTTIGTSPVVNVNNPVPTTTTISPSTKNAGDAAFTLTVNGTNFVPSSVVNFNGNSRTTTFVNSTQLTASIATTDVATGGTFNITVTNPTPGGGTSNSQPLTVNNLVPTTTSIAPASKNVGDAGFTLTVNGTNFVSTSVVNFNGSARTTTFGSATQLTATIPATDLTTGGTFNITVTNPAPGGGTSNAQTLTANNNGPTTTGISPASATLGSGAFTLTVNGTNFVSNSVVNFAGSPRTTTFVSNIEVTATIPSTDLTAAGTFNITVTNPAPGGGTSNSQVFTVNNPVPTTTTMSLASKNVGDGTFTLTVNGTNFVSAAVVNFSGSPRTTNFISATQVTASIPATDLTTAGTFNITVTNPTPGGGTSNPQTLTVNNLVPTTTSIAPASKNVGDVPFTLTVNGTNFVSASVVNFNGSARTTTFVSATQLTASITAADVAAAGTPSITVTNPAPGGGTSNAQTLTVSNPQPSTTSISPATKNSGDAAFTLTVNGTNFVSGSVVNFNGAVRTTTFVSGTQVTTAITTADVANAGTFNITVVNAAPGGGTSNAQILTVNPILVITSHAFATLTGTCSSQITSQTQNGGGSAANQAAVRSLTLSSNSTGGKFFSDAGCTTQVNSVTIGAGSSTANFFYSDTSIGTPLITVASTGLTSATQTEVETGLRFSNTALSVPVGQCSSALTLQSANTQGGNPSSLTQATTISLSSSSLGGKFYSDVACTTQITNTSIGPAIDGGHDSPNFFYKDTTAGSPVVTASAGTASATQMESVTKSTPVFTVTASQSITFGTASITLSGTLAAGTLFPPSGENVSITINSIATTATIGANGAFSATVNTSAIPASATAYVITYSYAGDANFNVAANTATTLTVNKAGSSTALVSSLNPALSGKQVTFTATVAVASGVPTGTVQFQDGGVNLGTAVPLANNAGVFTAQMSTSTLSIAVHAITAIYSGDTDFTGSTSGVVSQTVKSAATTISISAPAITYPANGLVTVSVAAQDPSAGTPSGNVTLSVDGGTALSQSLVNGSTTFTIAGPTAINHTLSTSYAAQNNFAASGPVTGTLVVSAAATMTSVSAPPVIYPTNALITVTVSSGAGTPTGNATLVVDGGVPLSAALNGGIATFTITNPSPGTHALSASYPAQGNFAGSGPATASLAVSQAPTISSAAATTFTAGTAGSFMVTTMGVPFPSLSESGALPSGITFTDNSNGTATLAGTTIAAGIYPITITATNGVGLPATQSFVLTVNAGAFTKLQVLVPGETAAPGTTNGKTGTPSLEYVNGAFNITVNAVDDNWNVVSSVNDTAHIISSDTPAVLPDDAALVAGTGTFSVKLVTPENPAATTITASDPANSSTISSSTSPAIEVVVAYTASISPNMAANSVATAYTLTVKNGDAPNPNDLKSVTIQIPVNGGIPTGVTVAATSSAAASPVNWMAETNPPAGFLRLRECVSGDSCYGSGSNDVTPGGSITIQFTTIASETINGAAVSEMWTTTAFSDAAYTTALPLAGPEPTVAIATGVAITSASSTTFTNGTAGTFTVTTTGFPIPTLSETGSLPSGVTFKDNLDGTATIAGTPTVAGTFITMITAHNGYGADATQTFTLTVNKATASVTLSNLTQTYTGGALTPTATTVPPGLTIVWTGAPDTNVGSYPVIATVNDSNYTGTSSGTFIINQAQATVTLGAMSQTYTASALTPTVTTIPPGLNVILTGAPDTNAGNYPVSATVNDPNYAGSASGTFIINQALATVMLNNLSQIYDGTPKAVSFITAPLGLNVAVTYGGSPNAPTNAGSYPVVATIMDPNYVGSTTGTLTIQQAQPVVIWSNPADITFGTALSSVQLNATAAIGATIIPGTFTYTPAASTVLNAGDGQTLSADFAPTDSTNYAAVLGTHVLINVKAAPLYVVSSDGSRAFGQSNPQFTPTFLGLTDGDTTSTVGTIACNSAAGMTSAPGTYAAICSGVNSSNYTVTYIAGTLSVTNPLSAITEIKGASSNSETLTIGQTDTLTATGAFTDSSTRKLSVAGGTSFGETALTTPVFGAAIAEAGGVLYAIGGSDGTNTLGTIQAYNPTTDIWTVLPNTVTLVTPRTDAAVTGAAGKIYVIGGKDASNNALSSVEVLDTTGANPAVSAFSGSLSVARSAAGAAVFNQKLYVIGGSNSANPALSSVDIFDLVTGNPMPGSADAGATLSQASAAVLTQNNISKLYVAGVSGSSVVLISFDGTNWNRPVNTSLDPVQGAGATSFGGLLYLVNGAGVWSYDGTAFVQKNSLGNAHNRTQPVSIGSLIYAATVGSGSASSNLDAFAPDEVKWSSGDATKATVDQSGKITTAAITSPTVAITATSLSNPAISADFLLTIIKKTQTIQFGTLNPKTYGDADFSISATSLDSSSNPTGLLVGFTAGTGDSCTVGASTLTAGVSNTTVHITGAGSCTITAAQPGDDTTWQAATSVPQAFAIAKAALTVTAADATRYYGVNNPTFTGTISGIQNGDNITATYASAATATSPVGTYPIMPTLVDPSSKLGNYNVTSNNGTLTVKAVAITVTADAQTKVYGDNDPALTYKVTTGALVNGDSFTGALVRDPGTSVGTYAIKQGSLALSTNYNLTYAGAIFTITPRPASVTPVAASKIYGTADPTFTGTLTGFITGDSVTATYTRTAGETVAGSPYAISATLAPATVLGNYNITYNTAAFTINKATASVTPAAASKTYGTSDPIFTGTLAGFIASDGVTATYTRTAGETVAGSPYAISATLAPATVLGNYNITYNTAAFTINKATASVTPATTSKTYGTSDPMFTGTLAGFIASDGVTATYTRTTGETVAGSPYAISATLAPATVLGNYSITYNTAAFTINKATASVTPAAASKTYGKSDPIFTGTLAGFIASDGVTATYARTAGETVAGSPYAISATLAPATALGNYNITYNTASFTITPAPLFITASSGTMIYGGPVLPITASYSGFVNGDGSANLSPQPSCGSTATSQSLVGGPYVSSCTGAGDSNYSITYISGTVTVMQATTTTTVVSSSPNNTSTYMQLVTFTATVAPQYAGTTPTGTVTFYNNGSSIGTGTLSATSCGTAPCADQATLNTSSLPDNAPDNITVVYGGDGNFVTSTSPAIIQTVLPAPNVSLSPMSVSFGNQNVNTTSRPAVVILTNIGDATLNINASGIAISPNTDFAQTNNCGASVLPTKSCTISITFSPVDTGIRTAVLQITDNDDDASGAQQTVALTGSGLSTIPGTSLFTDAVFATANGCGSIVISGGSTVDSFNSSQGYASSHTQSGGNVGTNGNVTLNGSKSAIYGSAAAASASTGNCSKTSVTGVTSSGGAQVTGPVTAVNGSISYPNPPAPNPAPPTTSSNISGSCGSVLGCSPMGTKSVSLMPGQYGNLNISGGTTAHFSHGTYNINSLTLSGQSILHVDNGPVVINLAGASLSGGNAAMDATGGSIENPTLTAENLQITYAGSRGLNLSGGAASYATVYAPNALVNMSGGTDFFGSIIASTVTNSGGTAIHYDSSLPAISANNYIWFTAIANNVQGLPSNGAQVKLYLTNSSISFTANGTPYTVPVPNSVVTFNSASLTTGAKTTYDPVNSRWGTAVAKSGLTGNTFVTGVAFQLPANFPTGVQNVAWSASYSTDTPGITLQWQWGAAVYNSFSSTYATSATPPNTNVLGVNAEDGVPGSDPAGTPETYKTFVIAGATGGGGTNYTGYLSAAAGVVPTVAPMSVSPSSLSFGTQNQGSTSLLPMSVTLTNNDGVAHTISSIAASGANASDFTVTNNCPMSPINTLAAGSSCTITVTFTPSDVGTRTTKIVVNDDAYNSPQTVYLSGAGQ
jgi:hypothetical protein